MTKRNEFRVYYRSKIGWIEVAGTGASIETLRFVHARKTRPNPRRPSGSFQAALRQLEDYFNEKRKIFKLKLAPDGTAFQKSVWRELQKIPAGTVRSYREVARRIGRGKAARAVGNAAGKNPLPIFIPCHRVVRNSGALGGYSGGGWRKEWLLRHEKD